MPTTAYMYAMLMELLRRKHAELWAYWRWEKQQANYGLRWLMNLSCVLAITVMAGCATAPARPHFIMYEAPARKLIIGERWFLKQVYETTKHDKPYSGGFYCPDTHTLFVEYDKRYRSPYPNMEIFGHEDGHSYFGTRYYK